MSSTPVDDATRRPRGLPSLARWVLGVFYRRIEVVGLENFPPQGALVVVGNHGSGLIDPALFLGFLPRAPRFLGKSTLWDMAALRPFLKLAAAIPVYRRQDLRASAETDENSQARTASNDATFERCYDVLAAGGVIGLFPEGRSHHEPSLVELKTGAARIVIEAVARFPGLDVEIVPVGLTFDDKTRFRSRALISIGDPLSPATQLESAGLEVAEVMARSVKGADPAAVHALNERLRRALLEVTLNYPSWEEARLIERAAAIYARPLPAPPSESPLGASFPAKRLFIDGYRKLLDRCPEEVHRVAAEVAHYERALELYRLRDEHVVADYPPAVVARFTLESLWLLVWRLPLGLLGSVVNFLPYRAAGWISRRYSDSPDIEATYKVLPSLALYPATWLLEGLVAGLLWGALPGVLVTALGPVSGLYAIRLQQRGDLFVRNARAFFLFHGRSRRLAELRERRSRVLEAVQRLAVRYLEPEP